MLDCVDLPELPVGELAPERISSITERTFKLVHAQTNELAPSERTAARQEASLEAMVTTLIHEFGVPAHVKGYRYLREAILLAVNDMDVVNAVTKVLYPQVSKMFGTTPGRVERAIRHAIETAWDRGDRAAMQRYFGCTIFNTKGKPTNSEFIALAADQLQLQLKKQQVR